MRIAPAAAGEFTITLNDDEVRALARYNARLPEEDPLKHRPEAVLTKMCSDTMRAFVDSETRMANETRAKKVASLTDEQLDELLSGQPAAPSPRAARHRR